MVAKSALNIFPWCDSSLHSYHRQRQDTSLKSHRFCRSHNMFARALAGFAVVGLVLCGLSYDAVGQTGKAQTGKAGQTAKKTDKAATSQTAKKKFEVPKDAIAGTVKSVDLKADTFTITLADKKDRTFKVDAKTEFWGPKGGDRGTGPAGLKDDCMEAGYEIKVTPAKDAKVAQDVYLPNRKAEKKGDTKKGDTKKK